MARPRLYGEDEHHRLRFSDAELVSIRAAIERSKESTIAAVDNAAKRKDLEAHYRRILMKVSRPIDRERRI